MEYAQVTPPTKVTLMTILKTYFNFFKQFQKHFFDKEQQLAAFTSTRQVVIIRTINKKC